jgi:hypothetical protein
MLNRELICEPVCDICSQTPAHENVTTITVDTDGGHPRTYTQKNYLCPACSKLLDKYIRKMMNDADLFNEQMFEVKALTIKMLQDFYHNAK